MVKSLHRGGAASAICGLALLGSAGSACASDLVYTPINPSFGGNPFNSQHLLGIANAINQYRDPATANASDPTQQFLRTLQGRLLSSLAGQIDELIFGENAQPTGLVRFGDQEVSFVRGADSVTLNIADLTNGTSTEIIIPLLQTGGN